MAATPSRDEDKWRVPVSLWVFAALFTVFVVNVLLGKATIAYGWNLPFLLNDVAEFLLLLFSAVFLMLGALARERGASDAAENGPENT